MAFTFTSQSKIFVDANATQGGTLGAGVQIRIASDFEDDPDSDVEVVLAIGVEGGAGFRHKTGGGTITFTENRTDQPPVNWRKWKRDKKMFAISAQDENAGQRQQWLPVVVAKVGRSMDAEGKHQDKITLKYLQSYF